MAEWQALGIVIAGWTLGSIIWARDTKGRMEGRLDVLQTRIEACERDDGKQDRAWALLDGRLRAMDNKLSRLMGRLGVPARAEDFDDGGSHDR